MIKYAIVSNTNNDTKYRNKNRLGSGNANISTPSKVKV